MGVQFFMMMVAVLMIPANAEILMPDGIEIQSIFSSRVSREIRPEASAPSGADGFTRKSHQVRFAVCATGV
jgi:hypothetical protein